MGKRNSNYQPNVATKRGKKNNQVLEDFSANDSSDNSSDSEIYDSDNSQIDSESEGSESDWILEESDEDSEIDFQSLFPNESYDKIYNEYTRSQKKLENDYTYDWKNGEKVYSEILSNEIFLSEKDKKKIFSSSFVELFELFFTEELKNEIINCTRMNGYDITISEFDTFIGILIFTSYNKRLSQRDYFSKNEQLGAKPVTDAMGRDRFEKIKKFLKYSKIEDVNEKDKAWRVRRILDIFQKNTLRFGIFTSALSVDEMMIKFFGKVSFKQFIKSKPIRFGIKMWGMCSPEGYLFSFQIYCGKNSENEEKLSNIALGSRVVIKMTDSLLNSTSPRKIGKYHVYFDNLFTSPDLLIHLKRIGLRATGTVRSDRVAEKNFIDAKATKGTYVAKHDKKSGMNFITVKDSKNVNMLSTAAGVTPASSVERYDKIEKKRVKVDFPNAFFVYNQFMGGVDVHDQHCNKLLPSIRSKRWTWVVFMRLIQASITNATVIYNLANNNKKNVGTKKFALEIGTTYLPRYKASKEKKKVSNSTESHKIIIQKISPCKKKCGVRTNRYCITCKIIICARCSHG